MRFFGLFSRSPKPRVQSSSLCAPAKTKDHHSVVFCFHMGIRKGERVFPRKTHRRRHAPREPFVPLPKKILGTRISNGFPRIFHFCMKSRLCLQNRRFSLIFHDFPNKKGVNLVSKPHEWRKSGKIVESDNSLCFLLRQRWKAVLSLSDFSPIFTANRVSINTPIRMFFFKSIN